MITCVVLTRGDATLILVVPNVLTLWGTIVSLMLVGFVPLGLAQPLDGVDIYGQGSYFSFGSGELFVM